MYLDLLSVLMISGVITATSFVAHVLHIIQMEYASRSLFSSARLVVRKSCVLLLL